MPLGQSSRDSQTRGLRLAYPGHSVRRLSLALCQSKNESGNGDLIHSSTTRNPCQQALLASPLPRHPVSLAILVASGGISHYSRSLRTSLRCRSRSSDCRAVRSSHQRRMNWSSSTACSGADEPEAISSQLIPASTYIIPCRRCTPSHRRHAWSASYYARQTPTLILLWALLADD
jgi:hypothetical protein